MDKLKLSLLNLRLFELEIIIMWLWVLEYNCIHLAFLKFLIVRRQSKVDSAMTAVSAGPGKSASQIYFYDWSDNYRYSQIW